MPKMATKAADNVFYKARMAAASWNDRLASREGTSELTGIDRTRLANIELGTVNPHPDEVLMLADIAIEVDEHLAQLVYVGFVRLRRSHGYASFLLAAHSSRAERQASSDSRTQENKVPSSAR